MGGYASTNGWGLGAPGCNAIDAELVRKDSNLCICCGLYVEGSWRYHDQVLCRRREKWMTGKCFESRDLEEGWNVGGKGRKITAIHDEVSQKEDVCIKYFSHCLS